MRFNNTCFNITNLDTVNKTNVDLHVAPHQNWHLFTEGYDLTNLNLTWTPWKFVNQSVKTFNSSLNESSNFKNVSFLFINVTFKNYAEISPKQSLDRLVLDILDKDLFISTENEILKEKVFERKIPR